MTSASVLGSREMISERSSSVPGGSECNHSTQTMRDHRSFSRSRSEREEAVGRTQEQRRNDETYDISRREHHLRAQPSSFPASLEVNAKTSSVPEITAIGRARTTPRSDRIVVLGLVLVSSAQPRGTIRGSASARNAIKGARQSGLVHATRRLRDCMGKRNSRKEERRHVCRRQCA